MKWLIIGIYLFSFVCVHLRGKRHLPLRQDLFGLSTVLAPINVFIYLLSRAASTPFVPPANLPDIAQLSENWQAIRAEAENLRALRTKGLESFYLKWYDSVLPSARGLCPRTSALLQSIPSIKLATFVDMRPGTRLEKHRDPYAGWLRCHVSLATPNDDACFIEVDGQAYVWRDGQAMVFDETYVHWAHNGCDTSRLILLCDIERPMRFRWAQAVNHFFGRMLSAAMNPPSGTAGHKGLTGALFWIPRDIGRYRRRLRSWSMAGYRITVLTLVAGLAVLLSL